MAIEKHRFLKNTHNPDDPEARKKDNWQWSGDDRWQTHLEFIEANIIGLPQATEHSTLEQQIKSGLVGIYAAD